MKTFDVSIDITSEELGLEELTALLGLAPPEEMRDKGSPRPGGGIWNSTLWRLRSRVPESAPLEKHCEDVIARATAAGLFGSRPLPPNVGVTLCVGVFFDTTMCSVAIPAPCLERLRGHAVGIEVSCYPSDMGEG